MNVKKCINILFAAMLLISWQIWAIFAAEPQEIKFQLLEGGAALSRTGGATWLELGPAAVSLKPQNMLRTAENSRGEIRFPDGSLFRVKADTRIMLTENGVQVQLGELWLSLKKRQTPFQLMTPTAACSVLGTEFDVNVDRFGRTRVRVFEGLVAVKAHEDPKKRQLVLQRGMLTRIENRTETPEQFQRFDAAGESARLSAAWSLQPSRSSFTSSSVESSTLPPIRPPSLESWRPVLATSSRGFTTQQNLPPKSKPYEEKPETGIRDNLSFFEQMRTHTLKAKRQDEKESKDYEVAPLIASRTENLPKNDSAWFGQGELSAPTETDRETLREEYLRMRERLLQLQQEIQSVSSEFEAARSELQAMSANDPDADALQQRLAKLSERLSRLREQRNELVRQLEVLRNRLS